MLLSVKNNKKTSEISGYILRSRWQCLMTSWNLMFIWSWQMAPYMLLMISVDRLLAVTKPFKYYKFTNRYSTFLVAGFYSPVIPVAIACAVSSYQYQYPENPAECLIQWAYSDWYLIFLYSIRITCASTSVLLFIPILFILQRVRISYFCCERVKILFAFCGSRTFLKFTFHVYYSTYEISVSSLQQTLDIMKIVV